MAVETTRVSSRGQVVIPASVREALGIETGDVFAVVGSGDTIVFKKVHVPDAGELDAVLERGHAFAHRRGITRRDVDDAIRDVRNDAA